MLDDWDIRQSNIYLMVDAVDECVVSEDRKRLLELIVQLSRKLPHVKWIISSRGWNDIRDVLADHRPMIRLALNPKSEVTLEAINTYIEYKVRALAKKKRLDPSNAAAIRDYLIDNAGGTFLWVALVCQKLEGHTGVRWKEIMQAFPPGLKELYKRMLQQIEGLDEPEANLCKFVLSVVTIAVRPLHLSELASLLKELDHITDKEAESKDILGTCGSFLSLHNGRVVFVHQSAKDYLTGDARKIVFPKGQKVTHAAIVARSMQLLSQFYQKPCRPRGSYGEPPESEASVNGLLYPTAHWPSHAMRSKDKITAHLYSGQGPVCTFLRQYEQRWLDEVGLAKGHQMAADLWTEFVDKNEYPEFDDILFSMFCKLPD
ncbi:hypothetical protein J4E93_009951 [Alternaria ventricosa]|uniref:uncharacterized protein n=1 Tax=Alternaria ventricosa TaxID=1187951 RepID=UPI0020C25602|nr:uncharacterized protein J4E93_009951 [Alternaria ventricosa]KAI4638650.1 hypothetical protein J4E93_009951 [Alternaria ventricosa]